jgi:subtilisin family serine protease
MASPVTAGVAAFLLEYFPTLTPQQVKQVIEKSSVPSSAKATEPGSDKEVSLSELSKTGGIINAYEAAKLASSITGQDNNLRPVKTKIKVKKEKRA